MKGITSLLALGMLAGYSPKRRDPKQNPKMKLSASDEEKLRTLSGKAKKEFVKELKQKYGKNS